MQTILYLFMLTCRAHYFLTLACLILSFFKSELKMLMMFFLFNEKQTSFFVSILVLLLVFLQFRHIF